MSRMTIYIEVTFEGENNMIPWTNSRVLGKQLLPRFSELKEFTLPTVLYIPCRFSWFKIFS